MFEHPKYYKIKKLKLCTNSRPLVIVQYAAEQQSSKDTSTASSKTVLALKTLRLKKSYSPLALIIDSSNATIDQKDISIIITRFKTKFNS